jgi:hypothetical protein
MRCGLLFVLFLLFFHLAVVLSVLLRLTISGYLFGIFQLFFHILIFFSRTTDPNWAIHPRWPLWLLIGRKLENVDSILIKYHLMEWNHIWYKNPGVIFSIGSVGSIKYPKWPPGLIMLLSSIIFLTSDLTIFSKLH